MSGTSIRDMFNNHLLQHNQKQSKRWICGETVEARRKGHLSTWKMPRVALTDEIRRRKLLITAYFPRRWRNFKRKKLAQFRKHTVNYFMTKLVNYSQDGMPKNPGPLPKLLVALVAIGPDCYLEPWETLRHQEYLDWLTHHVDSSLAGSDWRAFVRWADTGIARLRKEKFELQTIKTTSEAEASQITMLRIIQIQADALREVRDLITICQSGMDELTIDHRAKLKVLRDDAVDYLKTASEFYFSEFFKADPAQAVHERLLFKFHDWRLSAQGVNAKRRNGQVGFRFRQTMSANCGEQEDPEEFLRQGRFEDAEKTFSDEDDTYTLRLKSFDFHKEIQNFVQTVSKMPKPHPRKQTLLSTIKNYFSPPFDLLEDEKIIVACTTPFSGTSKLLSDWQIRFDKWRLVGAKRNLGEDEYYGNAQQKIDLGEKANACKNSKEMCTTSDSTKPSQSKEYSSHDEERDSSGADISLSSDSNESFKDILNIERHPQAPTSAKASEVKVPAQKKRRKGECSRSDLSEKSSPGSEEMGTKVAGHNGQTSPSTKEDFDVGSAALGKALEAFDGMDGNIQLMGLCFEKEKDIVGNQVSFTLSDKELKQRTHFETLSYAKAIARSFDSARFSCQSESHKEHLRTVARETVRGKGDDSKARIRRLCKEAELEIDGITKAVERALDAIP